MNIIKSKKGIEKQMNNSRVFSMIFVMLGSGLIMLFPNLFNVTAGIISLIFGILFFQDYRYWCTKLYHVKLKK